MPVSARKFSNVVISFDPPSEKGIQPGSDAPAWQGQSHGGRSGMGKFLHRRLFDIGRYPHFQKAGNASFFQRQCHKNLHLFCAPPPLFPCCLTPKVRIVKFDDPAQLMDFIPLAHGNANASEHGPCSFVGSPKHRRQLHSRNASLILTHKIERQKPLPQRHMCLMQHRPCRYRGLTAALGALISPVRQPVSMTAATSGANIPVLPAQRCQILLALCFAGESLQKRPKWQPLLLRHDPFPRFPVSWLYSIMRYVP